MPSVERTKWTSVAGQYVRRGFDSGRKSADCLIRDVCYEGARIIFSDPVNIPDIPDKKRTVSAHVQWRRGDRYLH